MFFQWAKNEYPTRYSAIPINWITGLKPPRQLAHVRDHIEHQYYLLDEILRIAALTPTSLTLRRGIAAMAFMFLSGMRVGAFLTMPISSVDLKNKKIYQLPSLGVATKFQKASITTLLNIPRLFDIVCEWDSEVRTIFPSSQTWYAPIRSHGKKEAEFNITDKKASPLRSKELRHEITVLCEQANIPFRSVHKLRHGHAMFGIKNAQNIQELKAVSQNLMHSSISITDGIYGNLSGDELNSAIANLGSYKAVPGLSPELAKNLLEALLKLQQNAQMINKLLEG